MNIECFQKLNHHFILMDVKKPSNTGLLIKQCITAYLLEDYSGLIFAACSPLAPTTISNDTR